jgi:deoxyribodipyrimidine photo-lyase
MCMQQEPKQFVDRQALIAHVKNLSPSLADETAVDTEYAPSSIIGGRKAAEVALAKIDPIAYVHNRNFLDGAVTRLSPYIRHGILSLNEVRNHALDRGDVKAIEKFIQELGWRDFWQRIYTQNPDWLWCDIEDYKTGFGADDYADQLPDDIANGETDSAAMNHFIDELKSTGYLHNHARMYLAAYIVHWRRVKWQAGAVFFLSHLLDGDAASNNLSFQWVASTFANKPYFFNLENLQKFAAMQAPCDYHANKCFGGTYDDVAMRLFPNLEAV